MKMLMYNYVLLLIFLFGVSCTSKSDFLTEDTEEADTHIEYSQEDIIGTWRWDYARNLGMDNRNHITTYTIYLNDENKLACKSEDVSRDWEGMMKNVFFKDGKLKVIHPRPNHFFEGKMAANKMSLKGKLIHHGLEVSFNIRKADPKTYEVLTQ